VIIATFEDLYFTR